MRSKQSPHTPPNVNVGDVIRVHVPPLPDLWTVDAVLVEQRDSGAYFLRISQNSGQISRTIAPRGFEIVSRSISIPVELRALRASLRPEILRAMKDLRASQSALYAEQLGVEPPLSVPIELPTLGRGRLVI
jgi:hypothetical protein